MEKRLGKVISVMNEKGGVGKSTTSTALLYLLNNAGKKVCLVDFDGQSHSTIVSGIKDPNRLETSIASIMTNIINNEPIPKIEDCVVKLQFGADIVPSCTKLFGLERQLSNVDFRETKLKIFIDELKKHYDIVIIDTMPSAGTMMINAMIASDYVIIPTQAEYLSAHGLVVLLEHIKLIKSSMNGNKSLEVLGILITMDSKNTKVSLDMKTMLKDSLGNNIRIFDTVIPRSIKVAEANLYYKTICEYLPFHAVSKAYEKLTNEILGVIGG